MFEEEFCVYDDTDFVQLWHPMPSDEELRFSDVGDQEFYDKLEDLLEEFHIQHIRTSAGM